ncbi:hybrid sensor histidine kinase/response regulator [Synoicihabitans lomoniglobus]|uniref:histidine kinase n=1 Tax=Synoicihabitans lomoniglobus TaxID=2909285 RepID=A0AAE9ZVV7_9BACT|nr:response regulator [Opitutaceae bacterium LMO-M01]WED64119.1 response regulator [Opitutaceae bacterium LMO-M01]
MAAPECILYVDDNDLLREQVTIALEMHDYRVVTATDGREGLEKALRHRPQLVLSDLLMPVMDGLEMLRELRQTEFGREVPFIFLTSRSALPEVREGMESGADDYLPKPFDVAELLRAVRARMDRVKAQRTALVKEQERMLVTLPHEMRTPLNAVMGVAQLLREELEPGTPVPDDTPSMIDMIIKGGERLERLTVKLMLHIQLDMLKTAGPEGRARFLRGDPIDPQVSLEKLVKRRAALHDRAQDLQIITCDGRIQAPGQVWEPIVGEVVDNASRFSAPGTPIRVELSSRNDSEIELLIADAGIGMTAEQIAEIAPFRQFHRPADEQQGMGLGLSNATQLTELSGGSIDISSPATGGLEVRIRLPRA